MRSLRFILPAIAFAVITTFLLLGLKPGRDPKEIPSPLIDKPAPAFNLPLLALPDQTWSPEKMRGQVWLLNVWASWCAPCLVEHPELLKLAQSKALPVVGFNYKDEPGAATAWLDKHGNPYATIVADRNGRTAFDYGVYGVPETFLIDRNGTIRYKHVGPLTPEVMTGKLLPLAQALAR
ncbi:MAG: DsbE family thiol:disulfide interchange protein [Burkholderiales bacterium]